MAKRLASEVYSSRTIPNLCKMTIKHLEDQADKQCFVPLYS